MITIQLETCAAVFLTIATTVARFKTIALNRSHHFAPFFFCVCVCFTHRPCSLGFVARVNLFFFFFFYLFVTYNLEAEGHLYSLYLYTHTHLPRLPLFSFKPFISLSFLCVCVCDVAPLSLSFILEPL